MLLLALAAVVLIVGVGAFEADAQKVRVRMTVPRSVDADTARLEGRAAGRDAVRIQRYDFGKHRWIGVKRVRAGRAGVFRTTVPRTHRWERYRAVAGPAESGARRVPAATTVVKVWE